MSVSMPPMLDAKAIGMRNLAADAPDTAAIETTMGSMRATVPVLLTKPPMRPVARTTTKNSLRGLPPPRRESLVPSILASPVLKMAPPTTNSPTIMMTIGFENPDKASCVVSIPDTVSVSRAMSATMSALSLPQTNPAAASMRVAMVIYMGWLLGELG